MRDYELTRQMIDYVFEKTNHFQHSNKNRNKAICEMRMDGAKFEEIGEAFNLSKDRCSQICDRVCRIYKSHLSLGRVTEVVTNFDRLKAMSIDELASFLAKNATEGGAFIQMADSYICRNCKKRNGGHCPVPDDVGCLFLEDDTVTIKRWLEGEVEE